MTLLSRKADYALLILSYLYQNKSGGTARAIAEQFGLSRSFVANILKELCQNGFVASHRGVKGGYALSRDAAGVSLAELLETVEDGFRLTVCNTVHADGAEPCSHSSTCTVKGPMAGVYQRLMGVLRDVTLAELFDPQSPPPALHALPLLAGSCSPTSPVEPFPAQAVGT
ncbi:Rrf2 family transcriptional regulator [Gemmata sp. JC717]|uniref:Rrf2 family transcriptional regulator n=1 Tax=Gemmata algarum TaxID=2975278 RepID=A0ABU5F311_9BACT|nr:Rrf2 family transcriptional regulator [Gemmata algarum]MDY3556769.1 Rrf2 family transcriptional regulator [Gemmata algarum]MDY3560306.1 Rrf2 family transcriptional regulator [Gemmata algarum]